MSSQLRSHGVALTEVRSVGSRTGVAHIRVDASGENDIVVAPLANADLTAEMVDESIRAVRGTASVLLLQLEIPVEVACHAAEAGARAGLTVVLDPAPAQPLPDQVWPHVDVVTPNESEAGALTGVEVVDVESAGRAAAWFLDRGVRHRSSRSDRPARCRSPPSAPGTSPPTPSPRWTPPPRATPSPAPSARPSRRASTPPRPSAGGWRPGLSRPRGAAPPSLPDRTEVDDLLDTVAEKAC